MEEELRKAFVELVEFVQQIGPDIWAIMVKQQIISGISTIVLWILACIGFIGSYRLVERKDHETKILLGIAGCALCGLGVFILTIVVFTHALPQLLNPQYYALMDLKP